MLRHQEWKLTRADGHTDPTKTTCTMFLQADHLFYQKFHSDMDVVIEQLTQHVQAVNDIYRSVGQLYTSPFHRQHKITRYVL